MINLIANDETTRGDQVRPRVSGAISGKLALRPLWADRGPRSRLADVASECLQGFELLFVL